MMNTTSPHEMNQFFGISSTSARRITDGKYSPSTHTVPSGTGSTRLNIEPETKTYNAHGGYTPVLTTQQEKVTPTNKGNFLGKLFETQAVRHDENKTNWSLMPWTAVEEINKVLEFGATKYAANNWQDGTGFRYTRVLNSMLRHIFAFMRGEDLDPESGLSHMAHAGCNVLFILYYLQNKNRYHNDDRNKA